MRSIYFNIPGEPKPKGSMRAFVAGKRAIVTHDNKKTKPWQSLVTLAASEAMDGDELFEGPLVVTLNFWLTRPKSITPKKRPMPSVKPDLDKLTRCIADALTGVVWADDAQVVNLVARKHYAEGGDTPGASVRVEEWTEMLF